MAQLIKKQTHDFTQYKGVKLDKTLTPIFQIFFHSQMKILFVNTKCVCQLGQQYEQSASGCSLDKQVTIDHLLLCHRWLLTSKMHIPLKTKFNGTFYLSKHHLKSIFPANLYGQHFQQGAKSKKILSEFVVQFYFFKATNFSFQDHT